MELLNAGGAKARKIARENMVEIREAMGFKMPVL